MDCGDYKSGNMQFINDYQAEKHHPSHLLSPGDLPAMPPMIGQLPPTPTTPSQFEMQNLNIGLQSVELSTQVNGEELSRQKSTIDSLTVFNEKIFGYLDALDVRLRRMENDNARLRDLIASHGFTASSSSSSDLSPEPLAGPLAGRAQSGYTSNLFEELDVAKHDNSEELGAAYIIGSAAPSPKTQTPASVTKPKYTTRSTTTTPKKKPKSLLSKRKVHDLTNRLPSAMAQMPLVPLTDTEIIVYFFNSLSRPAVSVRLYARGWGPAKIVQVLNAHRVIEPPYLRNTCSVKCITAQKRGTDKFGEEWIEEARKEFRDADDVRATELLAIQDDECEDPVDIDILELLDGLRMHPDERENAGTEAGIFTRCVKYCAENNQHWRISRIHQLAQMLDEEDRQEFHTRAGADGAEHDGAVSKPTDGIDDDTKSSSEMDAY